MKMYHVYIIKRDGKLYIGYTSDLVRRLKEHRHKYDCEVVYYETYKSEGLARDRELKLKQYGSAWRALKKRIGA